MNKNAHAIREAKEIETKTPTKKISKEDRERSQRKIEIAEISATEIVPDIEQKEVIAEEALPALAIMESPVKKISKRKRRKKLKKLKKRPMLAAFRLPRPCKKGICKPDICCRKTTLGKLGRIRYKRIFKNVFFKKTLTCTKIPL